MIKDFFIKKENIFIIIIALISIFFVALGFLFLFFKTDTVDGPRTIPNTVMDITWGDFNSKILDEKIKFPEYMYISEQKESNGVGVTIAEFEPSDFLNYFSNQNHVSIYPNGIDAPLFYGKTKDSIYITDDAQEYARTEYLTTDNEIWAVKLVPKKDLEKWQTWGFVWIQTKIQNKEQKCITESGLVIDSIDCDPYQGQKIIYSGKISSPQFLQIGYEIVNKNSFK